MIKIKNVHYLNGFWVNSEQLKISAFDLGVIRGFGVFDFLRTYHQKPFMLDEHLDRLFRSAKFLGIKIHKTKREIKKIVLEGIKKNPEMDLNIRLVVTGGISSDSLTSNTPSLIIMFTPTINYSKELYEKGIKIISFPTKRDFPQVKTLNYLTAILALKAAKKRGAVEAIYVNEKGQILEGTTSNFFAVINNQLFTPKEEILFGITRKAVIDLAKKIKIPIREKNLYLSQIKNFTEAFITSTTKEIMPVTKIDNQRINDGQIGEITKKLLKEFWKMTKR